MKFIMTGSKGLIGETLMKRLLNQGNECVLDVDFRDGQNIINMEKYNVTADIMFHLASFCKINKCILNPDLAFENNVLGTYKVFEYCVKNNIKKIVFFSSSRVLSPERNPYTASKEYGELLCEAYKQCYGIDYIIVRPSTVYSSNHIDKTGRLLTLWVESALKNETLKLYGDENKTLDFTHVDDFCDGIELLLNKWDEVKNQEYDISGEEETKLVDVATMISQILDKPIEINLLSQETAQPQQVKIDISKMKELGYSSKIKLKDGLKKLVEFYKNE